MNLIVTADSRWAIGKGGQPLVTIPADRQMFLKETKGKVVVMGRKTLEALPGGQPLGGRMNLVLTHDRKYCPKGVKVCHSLEKALSCLNQYPPEDIYVIGGRSIYEQFLPYCADAHVTRIDYTYDADTFLPDLDKLPDWELAEEGEEQTYFNLCYTFQRYVQKKNKKIV